MSRDREQRQAPPSLQEVQWRVAVAGWSSVGRTSGRGISELPRAAGTTDRWQDQLQRQHLKAEEKNHQGDDHCAELTTSSSGFLEIDVSILV